MEKYTEYISLNKGVKFHLDCSIQIIFNFGQSIVSAVKHPVTENVTSVNLNRSENCRLYVKKGSLCSKFSALTIKSKYKTNQILCWFFDRLNKKVRAS